MVCGLCRGHRSCHWRLAGRGAYGRCRPVRLVGKLDTGATYAARAALRMLDQLHIWKVDACAVYAELSARTPSQLITVPCDWPLVTLPMAEAQIEVSRATIPRRLNRMAGAGLIR